MKDKIEYIVGSGTDNRKRIDALLELDRDNVDLGKGFTKESLKASRKNSLMIYKAIGKIDKKLGELLLNHVDR